MTRLGLGIQGAYRALPLAAVLFIVALAHLARTWLGPLDPLLAQLPRVCPLLVLTGIRCPTCGLGRALIDAAAGDFAHAFHHHPLGPLLLIGALVAAVLLATRPALLTRTLSDTVRASHRHPRWMALLIAGYIVWGATREMYR